MHTHTHTYNTHTHTHMHIVHAYAHTHTQKHVHESSKIRKNIEFTWHHTSHLKVNQKPLFSTSMKMVIVTDLPYDKRRLDIVFGMCKVAFYLLKFNFEIFLPLSLLLNLDMLLFSLYGSWYIHRYRTYRVNAVKSSFFSSFFFGYRLQWFKSEHNTNYQQRIHGNDYYSFSSLALS